MKILFAFLLISISTISFAFENSFYIDRNIHNNSDLEFIPHHGNGLFGTYLTMEVNFEPMANLFRDLLLKKRSQLANRGESHITVITPKAEYFDVLRKKMTMAEIDSIALQYDIQSSDFEIICLGRGTARVNNKKEETFFIVVQSEKLLKIRRKVQKLFINRGGDASKFNPEKYYPHITLGFSKRDLHESDGVIKDSSLCYAEINYQSDF